MKLLVLDTATEACSVALNIDGDVLEHYDVIPRRHSRELLPMIEKLLNDAGFTLRQMDALAFGRGPGAFTGLRVATAMVQGLAFAVDCPVIPISTLAALAQQGYRRYQAQSVLSVIDARMDEVYWGAFIEHQGVMTSVCDEQVTKAERLDLPPAFQSETAFGMGTGWGFHDRLPVTVRQYDNKALPHAADMAVIAAQDFKRGKVLPAEAAMPVYLRDKVALKKDERQALLE
ncbi:tRNA (adenosine(37)-N6)-threonylcarbamoyltransferase complex dimerization subunit type 1 TsaB [Candidatus Sororendozoicomonas aggregata]|uniref:tRNA (adenosine(37)-N6)-threonylcarbamoyltransferase complex dimerization subunit type 1 TsaB n=1 Tax=Candidatus Sororendozoicomonas aggregata TaxID=3073239 RepID=UPI002ED4DEAF